MKKQIKQLISAVKNTIHKNEVADMLITNYDFRTFAFSAVSFIGGIGIIIFNIVVFAVSNSLWCGAMIFYHGLLTFLRGYLLLNYYRTYKLGRSDGESQTLKEIKRYRFCGIAFIALTLCLMALVLFIVRGDKVFTYGMYALYTVTGYTLCQMAIAIANYIKASRNDNYTVRALRCINLTSALVSFISVQAISLDTFSTNVNVPLMNALTGVLISALIVASGVYMIVHSTIKIKTYSKNTRSS